MGVEFLSYDRTKCKYWNERGAGMDESRKDGERFSKVDGKEIDAAEWLKDMEKKEHIRWTGVGDMKSKGFFEENKFKIILGLIAAVVIAFAAQHFYFTLQNRKQAREYEQMLEEAEHNVSEIIVTDNITVEKATIMEVMKAARELVVYKYYYTDVGEYKKDQSFPHSNIHIPFTMDKTLYTYTGTISAGIDLAKVDEDHCEIDDEKQTITITLPKPKILYHDIDDKKFQSYNVNNSVFTTSDLGDYKEFERKLKNEQEEKLGENDEFWSEVRKNTETAIKDMLTLSGQTEDYKVDFAWE